MTSPQPEPRDAFERRSWWIAWGLISLSRALPFLRTFAPPRESGQALLPIGYVPTDVLQYVALFRQVADAGRFFFENPFTTTDHPGRYILPIQALLGLVMRMTNANPFWLIELARIAAIGLLLAAAQRVVRRVFATPSERRWAFWLIALSGGVEFIAIASAEVLPLTMGKAIIDNLWSAYGWSTFAAMWNPISTIGLTVSALFLSTVLDPNRDARAERPALTAGLGVVLFALFWLHPYSALSCGAVLLFATAAELIFDQRLPRWLTPRRALSFGAAVLGIAAVSLWQRADPVFAYSSGNIFGRGSLSISWYPFTLGAVGVFALLGARRSDPWTRPIASWIAAIAFLHALDGFSGFHFVFQLHLPVCLLAARVLPGVFERAVPVRRAALLVALFFSPIFVTAASVRDVVRPLYDGGSRVPQAFVAIAQRLGELPRGKVLAPFDVGNVLPAYSSSRVWVGHWFLTPDQEERASEYSRLVRNPGPELQLLTAREGFQYLVVRVALTGGVAAALGSRVARIEPFSDYALVVLQ